MERCLTILPPRPPLLITVRAALSALWFRAVSAGRSAFRRATRAPVGAPIAVAVVEHETPMVSLHACHALPAPSSSDRITREDDRWLRRTEVLPLQG